MIKLCWNGLPHAAMIFVKCVHVDLYDVAVAFYGVYRGGSMAGRVGVGVDGQDVPWFGQRMEREAEREGGGGGIEDREEWET